MCIKGRDIIRYSRLLCLTIEQNGSQNYIYAMETVADSQGGLSQLHLKHHYDVVQEVNRKVCTHIVCWGEKIFKIFAIKKEEEDKNVNATSKFPF